MSKNLTKIKNFLGKIIIVLGIICLALFARVDIKSAKTVFALNKKDVSEDFLTNPNFYSTSSSNIASNSHWSTVTPDDEDNASSFKKGIVNVDRIEQTITEDKDKTTTGSNGVIVNNLWKNYGLFESPGKVSSVEIGSENTDGINNYLMINAYNFSGHIGYKSDSYTLQKGSYYKIAVTLKTINKTTDVEVKDDKDDELTTETRSSDASASIYLDGISDSKAATKFENLKTNNAWKTYYFYISTNSFTAESNINIQLYLGSKTNQCQGAVFFSEVKIEQYSESEYNKEATASRLSDSNVNGIDLNNAYDYTLVSNGNFEKGLTDWNIIGSATTGDVFVTAFDTRSNGYLRGNSKYPAIPKNNNSSSSNVNAIAIYSNPDDNKSTYYGVESNTFTIKQYGLYRISLWAYSDSGSSNGAYITLFDNDNDTKTISQQISTSVSSDSKSLTNDWTEYEFYVQGHSLRDCNLKLQLTIGKDSSKDSTVNYAMFDDIRVQEINYSQYNSGKKSTNTLAMTSTQDSSYLIANNNFDDVKNEDMDTNKPLTPAGWTLNSVSDSIYAGVINTNAVSFASRVSNYGKISNLLNPGKIDQYSPTDINNVLMMGTSSTNKTITYTTESTFSLSANSYYKLSFNVFTQELGDSNKGADFYITDSNNVQLIAIENMRTNSAWATYTYYIATNASAKTCNAILNLSNTACYAYFDNIQLTSITKDLYNELIGTENENQFIDLNKNYLTDTNNWTKSSNGTPNANVGFIKSSDYDISVDGEKIIYISSNTGDTNYTLTSVDDISVTANSFYKLTAYINTYDIRKFASDNNTKYGAKFCIKYNDKVNGIYNITTNTNEFVKYTIYLATNDTTTLKLILGLGNEDNLVSGTAYFTKIEVTKFDSETAMNDDRAIVSDNTSTYIEKQVAETENGDNSDEDNKTTTYSPNWLAISSLITSVAMVAAIIAFFIRKIDFKKKRKKVTTNYDRRKTLDKRYDIKERIEYRESLIEGLNKDLEDIKNTTKAFKADYDNKLNQLKTSADTSSESLRKQYDDLEAKKLEISKVHNAKIAEDKLHASKEEDIKYNEEVAVIEKEQKAISIKIKHIDKVYDKEKVKYEELIARSEKRQKEIKDEIENIRKEIKSINEELINLNTNNNSK